MNNFYEVKVKLLNEEGKKVIELNLFEAVSFTDAEKRAYKHYDGAKDFSIENIAKKTNISEVITDGESERRIDCKVEYMSVSDEKVKVKLLVQADNLESSLSILGKKLINESDFEVKGQVVTNLIDVLFLEKEGE